MARALLSEDALVRALAMHAAITQPLQCEPKGSFYDDTETQVTQRRISEPQYVRDGLGPVAPQRGAPLCHLSLVAFEDR